MVVLLLVSLLKGILKKKKKKKHKGPDWRKPASCFGMLRLPLNLGLKHSMAKQYGTDASRPPSGSRVVLFL